MKNKKHQFYLKCKDQKQYNKDQIKKKQEGNYNMKLLLKYKDQHIKN